MKGGRTGTWWGGNDGLRGGTAQVEGIKTEDKGWERGDNKRENEPAEEKRNGNAPGGGKKWNKQYSTGGRTQAHTFTSIYCSNVTIWEVKPNQSKSRWGPGVQYICSIWIYDNLWMDVMECLDTCMCCSGWTKCLLSLLIITRQYIQK